MKLLCITGDFLPQIGGMQLSTHQTLLALFNQGVQLTLVANEYGDTKAFDENLSYPVFRKGRGGYLDAIRAMLFVKKLYQNEKFDYVLLMGHFPEIAYAILCPILPFSPIILAGGTRLYYPNSWFKKIVRNFFLKRSYNRAQKIIAISQATKYFILKYCPSIKSLKCIPRPIDESLWNGTASSRDAFTISTISRLTATKNIEEILYALSEFDPQGKKNWVYWLFGDGEDRDKLEVLARSLNLNKRVKFWGQLQPKVLVDKMKKVNLNILLSQSESFGRVCIEAAALGIPSITYKTYGSDETIKNGYTGYVVEQGDKIKVVKLLIDLYENKKHLDNLSRNAREFYLEKFSKKKVGMELVKYICETTIQ